VWRVELHLVKLKELDKLAEFIPRQATKVLVQAMGKTGLNHWVTVLRRKDDVNQQVGMGVPH
jgi:hypothetical protein